MPTVAELDVKINADDDATSTIARLDALLRGLDGDNVDVDVDVDTGEADADIAHLIEEINSISDETVTIEVDTDGAGENIAALEAELKSIPDETVTIETDVDDAGIKRGTSSLKKFNDTSLNASRQVSLLAAAVLGLGTALIPIGAVAVGGVVALASAFTVAAAGIGLFALVAKSAFGPVTDALKKMNTLQQQFNQATTDKQRDAALAKMQALLGSLTDSQLALYSAITRFRGAWAHLVAQFEPQVFQIATEGLDGLAKILPSLAPIIGATAGALLFLERAGTRALAGPFWQSFIKMLGQTAGPLIREFGLTIGNLITGFAALIGAFMPLTLDFSQGLLGMSKSFSTWAQNLSQSKGFQDFVAYVRENTPLVLRLIGQFVMGFIAVAKAGAPLGEALVKAATRLFELIDAFQKAHPGALTLTLALIGIGAVALNLIGPLLLVGRFVLALVTGFGYLGTAAGVIATALGTTAAVVLGVVAIVAALVVGIIYAYNHFKTFHDIVDAIGKALLSFGQTVASAVIGGLQSAATWLTSTFGPAVRAVMDFVVEQFNKVRDWATQNAGTFEHAWSNITSVVSRIMQILWGEISGALSQISALWNFFWPTLSAVLMGVWTAIKGVVSGALDIIMGFLLIFAGLFSGEWGKMWQGLVQVLTGIWEIIKGVVTGGFQVLQALVTAYLNVVKAIWSAAWGLISSGLRAAWNTMVSIVKAAWGAIVATFRAFQQTVQAGVNAFWSAVIAIFRGAWNLVTSGLRAAWNTASSLTSSAWNGIKGVVSSAASSVAKAVRDKISDAIGYIRDFGPRALGILSGLGGKFYNAGASLLKSLADGIGAGIGAAVGKMRDAVGQLTDLLPGSPAKTGPLSGQGYAYIRGQHLAEDLASGIAGQSGLVERAARDMADLMSLSTDPAGAFDAITRGGGGGGGITINVGEGAVAVNVGDGTDPKAARAAFDGAGGTVADALLTAIRRREG